MHLKEKNFKCEYCDAKFGTKFNKKIHIKMIHDNIKDYKCNECDYKASRNIDIHQHIHMVHKKTKNLNAINATIHVIENEN